MRRELTIPVLLALCAALSIACETPQTNSGKRFGDAVRNNTEEMLASNQTDDGTPIEPQALDGPSAAGVVENYHDNETGRQQRRRMRRSGITDIDQTNR